MIIGRDREKSTEKQFRDFQLSELDGYDRKLESARKLKFREFFASTDARAKRKAFNSIANLTALRSPKFVTSYEAALGLR